MTTPARFMTISASDYAALRNRERIFREALEQTSEHGETPGRDGYCARAREALTRAEYESPISYASLPAPEKGSESIRSLGPFTDSWPPRMSPMALHPDLPSATEGHKPGDYANRARSRINNRANSGADITAAERAIMDLSYAIDSLAAAFEARCPEPGKTTSSPPEKIAPFESFEELQAAQRERIERAIARQEPQSLEREIVDLIMRECASDRLTDAEALAAAREVIAIVLAHAYGFERAEEPRREEERGSEDLELLRMEVVSLINRGVGGNLSSEYTAGLIINAMKTGALHHMRRHIPVADSEWAKKTATCIRAMWNQVDFGPELERVLGRSVPVWGVIRSNDDPETDIFEVGGSIVVKRGDDTGHYIIKVWKGDTIDSGGWLFLERV